MMFGKKKLMVIYSRDLLDGKKDKYIRHIRNGFDIYYLPISGFFEHKGDTILVYSKKDRFINPWKYSSEFSSKMKKSLLDNFATEKVEGIDFEAIVEPMVLDHSPFWKIAKGSLIKNVYDVDPDKIVYGRRYFDGYDFDGKGDSLSKKINGIK